MAAVHNALAWASSILAIVTPVVMIMGIRLQQTSDPAVDEFGFADAEDVVYLRSYRFLWATLPIGLFLLILVAAPIAVCGNDCYTHTSTTRWLIIALVLGLTSWSLTLSLLLNRYFHSGASRPFRYLKGTEQNMLRASRLLALGSVGALVVALV